MYIRKNTKLDVTIFDVSLMKITDKQILFNDVIKLHNDSIASLSNKDETTRLVVPTIFNKGNIRETQCGSSAYKCLFNDILGYNKTINRDIFGDTTIISTPEKNFIGKGKKKKFKQSSLEETTKITVDEPKTLELLNKHHKKFLNNSKQEIAENYDMDFEDKIREYALTYITGTSTIHTDVSKPTSKILKNTDKVLFINATYSIGEIHIALKQMSYLFRLSLYSNISEDSDKVFYNYTNCDNYIESVYAKYKIKGTEIWKRNIENKYSVLEEHCTKQFEYDSLLNEDTDVVKEAENVFIPVTFIFFLEKGSHLFVPTDKIIQENHIIRNPGFFVNKCSFYDSLGSPDFLRSNNKFTQYIKPQSNEFNKPLTDLYTLKTTLTNIPTNFSERLLKSKLKSIDKFEVNKECFHFFSDEQIERITEKGKENADFFFCFNFDGSVNLSYYTQHIYSWLINNFASYSYSGYIEVGDLISSGKLISQNEKVDIVSLFKELETKQNSLSYKFNSSSITLLSKEMFNYEKAMLLFIYLLKSIKLPLFTLCRNDWSSISSDDIKSKLIKNNYVFSKEILDYFYSVSYSFLSIESSRKAYLIEALYRMVSTIPEDQLLNEFEKTMKEITEKTTKILDNLTLHLYIGKDLKKVVVDSRIGEVISRFESVITKKRKILLYNNSKLHYLLSTSKSLQLIPLLCVELLTREYLNKMSCMLRCFISYTKIYWDSHNCNVVDSNGLSTRFLTDPLVHESIYKYYSQWYSSHNDSNVEIQILKKVLATNVKAKDKIETIDLFVNLLIKEFSKEYFSSEKI